MKKALLILLVPFFAYGAPFTKTQVDVAVENSIGFWSIGAHNFTNSVTGTYAIIAPPAGFDHYHAGSGDITVNTNGTFTCNFDGAVSVDIASSFFVSGGTSEEFHTDVFLDAVDTDFGFTRTIGSNSSGSACAGHPSLDVSNGDAITVMGNISSDKSVVFHSWVVTIRRID